MNTVHGTFEGGVLKVFLAGHIDSANAGECENGITALYDGQNVTDITVDAQSLEYISSAGLRILLRLRKKPGI